MQILQRPRKASTARQRQMLPARPRPTGPERQVRLQEWNLQLLEPLAQRQNKIYFELVMKEVRRASFFLSFCLSTKRILNVRFLPERILLQSIDTL